MVGMTIVDWAIIVLLLVLVPVGYHRGLLVAGLGLGGFALGAAIGARVAPLVDLTLDALEPVLAGDRGPSLAGVYVVGGASALPIIPRRLRERFGRRMHRSPYPAGAVAIVALHSPVTVGREA